MNNTKGLCQEQIDLLKNAYKQLAEDETNWCERLNQPCSTFYFDKFEQLKKVKPS